MLWTIPILAVTAMALTWFYRQSTYKLFDDPLESAITELIASVQSKDGDGANGELFEDAEAQKSSLFLTREPIDPRYQRALSGRYWMIGTYQDDGSLLPLLSSRSFSGETIQLPSNVKRSIEAKTEFNTTAMGPDENEPLRILARSVILPSGEPVLMLAGADIRDSQRDVRRFAFIAAGLMLLLSGGLVFAVFLQVRTGLRPLFELRDRVVDIREGRADHVGGTYPREIAPLANELNSLIGHNKDVVERAQTHVSNLAHGLKTPLAVLLNEAGGSKSKLAEIVNRQANAMKNQVDHHLQRARAATRGQSIGMATSVAESVDPLARTLGRIYRDKDIDFDVSVAQGLIFRGEKRDFEEIIGNLMDNACKWTKSKVRVIAQGDGKDNGLFMLEVSDDGEGLTKEQYPEALKRGARLDETTPGTGFGLPIVDDLARAYKGSLVLGKSDLGGLKVTVTLPGRIDE